MKVIKLLLVDDEKEFLQSTSTVLKRRGFDVAQAQSGSDALQALARATPDLVVLDLKMEGMDGIATLQEIRKTQPDLPVIILTGHGGFDDAMSGIYLGVVDFLQKPVDVEHLSARIRKLLSEKQPLREKTIAELMVPESSYQRIYSQQTVREAIEALLTSLFPDRSGKVTDHGHRAVLVFDRQERFVGLVRLDHILRLVIPPFLQDSPYSSYFTGMFLAQSKLIGNTPIEEIVDGHNAVRVDAPLMKALFIMISKGLTDLPVLENERLVGVLRDRDVLIEIAAIL